MKKLLRDVYALDGSMDRAERCDLLIDGEFIAQKAAPRSLSGAECDVFDGKGEALVLPGFFNAHCHAAMVLLRGLGEERPLMEWLQEKIWPLEEHLTDDVVYAGTLQAVFEMAVGGVTGFTDMYYHTEQVARVAQRTGIRCGVPLGVVRDPERFRKSLYCDYGPLRAPHGLICIDPHAPYTVPFEFMAETAEEACRQGVALQTHFLEAPWERGYFAETLKMTPVEYLEKTGLSKVPHLVLAHGVQLLPEEIEYLASHDNIAVVHCPASNLKLGSGAAPVPEMVKSGVHVALGTDGAASNNRLDLWGEMRLAALLHKGVRHDPLALTAKELLNMATFEGARAFGFEKVGKIREGWFADLAIVDIGGARYVGADEDNLATYVVYAGGSEDVTDVLCCGSWIVRGKKFLPLPEQEIVEQSRRQRSWLVSQRA
ncbi:MAG: amidohydrolase [Pyramidobacter sp.]|jgi:5-methylthioadenosine/S-adenosylhomocysteine deaminase